MTTRRAEDSARNKARGRQVAPQKKFPLVPVIIGVVVVALIALAVYFLLPGPGAGLTGEVDQTAPGEATEVAPTRNHVATTVQYLTSPPTSATTPRRRHRSAFIAPRRHRMKSSSIASSTATW